MKEKIIAAAEKYMRLAEMLKDMETDKSIGGAIPEDVQAALLKLYYAKQFEAHLEKCEDFLDENSDEETAQAMEEAQGKVDAAAQSAFVSIEEYESEDKEFARMIEGISVSSAAEGLYGLLCKLYKCEGIIMAAYRSASKLPLYGFYANTLRPQSDFDVVMNEEDYIMQKLGVDMYELREIRQGIIEDIAKILGDGGLDAGCENETGDL